MLRILHKALNMPQLSIRVDNLLLCLETLLATSARHRFQAHVGARCNSKKIHLITIMTQIKKLSSVSEQEKA